MDVLILSKRTLCQCTWIETCYWCSAIAWATSDFNGFYQSTIENWSKYFLIHSNEFHENPYLALGYDGLQMLYTWWQSVYYEGQFKWRTQHLDCSICYSIQGNFLNINIWQSVTVSYKGCVFCRKRSTMSAVYAKHTARSLLYLLFHSQNFPENPYKAHVDSCLQML